MIMLNWFLKSVRNKYEMIDYILKMLVNRRREGFDVKEDIISYIESEKFNVNHTIIITCKILYVIIICQ